MRAPGGLMDALVSVLAAVHASEGKYCALFHVLVKRWCRDALLESPVLLDDLVEEGRDAFEFVDVVSLGGATLVVAVSTNASTSAFVASAAATCVTSAPMCVCVSVSGGQGFLEDGLDLREEIEVRVACHDVSLDLGAIEGGAAGDAKTRLVWHKLCRCWKHSTESLHGQRGPVLCQYPPACPRSSWQMCASCSSAQR